MQKLILLVLLMCVAGCTRNIQSPIDPAIATIICQMCEPIYGRASDWDNISDDLARNIYRHNRMCEEQSLRHL